jgi:hypothetical protein
METSAATPGVVDCREWAGLHLLVLYGGHVIFALG